MVKRLKYFLSALTLLLIILAIVFLFHPSAPSPAERLETLSTAPWAPFAYVFIYLLATGLGYPASLLTIVAGPLFGLWKGFIYVLVASNLTAVLCFGIARKLGTGFVDKFMGSSPLRRKLDTLLHERGFEAVFLLRLFPIHFALFNYVSGLSTVTFRDYTLGTILGKAPGMFLYVWFSVTMTSLDWRSAIIAGLALAGFLVLGQKVRARLLV
ncbi:MAG: TVP38/TMEM64 family protein [Firmicutes bacterium]|nr:TVP38/TMEM64 family protein [Bacillota bacterium]